MESFKSKAEGIVNTDYHNVYDMEQSIIGIGIDADDCFALAEEADKTVLELQCIIKALQSGEAVDKKRIHSALSIETD